MISSQIAFWRTHVLFSFEWWFLVLMSILLWTIWWKTVDRGRLPQIVMFGGAVLIVTTLLDGMGAQLLLWDYPVQLTPTYSRFIPVDFVALPVSYMWVYQYFRSWRSFLISVSATSALFSFVLEPLATSMGLYVPLHWKSIYSFPIYTLIGIIVRMVVEAIFSNGQNALRKSS
ncbi:hypothetical protein AN477_01320 [Alicyclobacillus ferrooxydans]|uniref:Uncharacterized protein n=1 Tax=Alicyclobacillus ferrooxydans TaxID=471514 RepID=A0A0P9EQ96_9BACL|nr:hypothetical protein AN477_01320 [Alicyclobacillus ferrooxydans]